MPLDVIAPKEAAIIAALILVSGLGMAALGLLQRRQQQPPLPRWIFYLTASAVAWSP